MTEWIDFVVYAVQVLLVWVFLPRQGRQFTLPTIADRNPDWLAGHRDVAARIDEQPSRRERVLRLGGSHPRDVACGSARRRLDAVRHTRPEVGSSERPCMACS